MSSPLDKIDITIVQFLSEDSKLTYKKIADKLEVSSQTVKDRIDKLIKRGIIKRFTINIEPEKLNFSIEFICELDINASVMDDVLMEIKKIPEIHNIKITTGIHDILCIGNASSIANLHDIVEKKISMIPGVNKTYTSITLKKIKQNQILNFDTNNHPFK